MNKIAQALVLLVLCGVLAACGERGPTRVKIGGPYSVKGETYYPGIPDRYDEVGMASWYGPGFHGGRTANGEKYDQDDLTAAHRTLPLPSLVRVTNLSNGRSAVVRINDRGPFAHGRIIDLSRAAAEKIGLKQAGVGMVRVQFLRDETIAYWETFDPKFAARVANQPVAVAEREVPIPVREAYGEEPLPPSESLPASPLPPEGESMTVSGGGRAMPVESADLPPATAIEVTDTPPTAAATLPPEESEEEEAQEAALTIPPKQTAKVSVHHKALKQFYVRVGSFAQKQNADHLVQKLGALANVEIQPVAVGSQTWYRVQLGPLEGLDEANAVLYKVSSYGIHDAKIINE